MEELTLILIASSFVRKQGSEGRTLERQKSSVSGIFVAYHPRNDKKSSASGLFVVNRSRNDKQSSAFGLFVANLPRNDKKSSAFGLFVANRSRKVSLKVALIHSDKIKT